MRFKILKENTLLEDIATVKTKYPTIKDDVFNKLIRFDPTFKEGADKLGTYGKWILDKYKAKSISDKDFGHIKDALSRFDSEKNKLLNKDIYQFKTLEDIDNYLNDESNYKETTHRQEVRQRQKERKGADLGTEASKVYEDSKWTVYVPHTYAASCKLGQGASWCTASTESDYYYNMYKDRYGGEYYIIINNTDPEEKYQFHFESNQFMDKDDRSIELVSFFLENDGLRKFFYPIIGKAIGIDTSKKVDTIEISGSNLISVFKEADDYYREIIYGRDDDRISFESIYEVVFGDGLYDWFMDATDYSYDDIVEHYGIPKLNEDVKNQLVKLGIDLDNLEESIDDSDYYYDIISAFSIAYNDAVESGSYSEMEKSVNKALKDCGISVSYDPSKMTMVVNTDEIIESYLENSDSSYYDNVNEFVFIEKLVKDCRVYEPRYGYYGFDEETFNGRLYDELYNLVN